VKNLVREVRGASGPSSEFPRRRDQPKAKQKLGPIATLLNTSSAKARMNELIEPRHSDISALTIFRDESFQKSLEQLHFGHAVDSRLAQKLLYEPSTPHHQHFVQLLNRVAERLKGK